jgi:hypothetical protein
MLWHPPGIRNYPLTNHWWRIEEAVDTAPAHVVAVLEFVEGMKNDFWGKRIADTRFMRMRWDIKTLSPKSNVKAITVRWTSAWNSQYLMSISSRMGLLTDQMISEMTGSGIVPKASANPRSRTSSLSGSSSSSSSSSSSLASSASGGLRAKFSHSSGGGLRWGETSEHHKKPSPKTKASARNWPTPQDYHEAVQNPHIAFIDKELSSAEPELTPLGLPKVASGAFASVYRMKCRRRDLALRCFLRSIENQAYRYNQLSKYILADDLSYTIGFEFQLDGIRIHADSFPVLKMEWIEGTQFNFYIEENLQHADKMAALLTRFRKMTGELRDAGVAHGDLQHGNILVKDDELYLVDYDGMYVPSLAGEQSNELGHGNYQHPGRNSSHFGAYLDNFSAWVIDTSLFGLSVDPSLWKLTGAGDECLLFRRKDFLDPHHSAVFHTLTHHSCKELRQRAQFLMQLIDRPLDQIPWLGSDGNPLAHAAVFTAKDIEKSLKATGSMSKTAVFDRSPDTKEGLAESEQTSSESVETNLAATADHKTDVSSLMQAEQINVGAMPCVARDDKEASQIDEDPPKKNPNLPDWLNDVS